MDIQNIEELHKRIEDNKGKYEQKGFIYLGHGAVPSLRKRHGLDYDVLHSSPYTGPDKLVSNKWSGNDPDKKYYVTEHFYNTNIKEQTIMTPTQNYREAQEAFIKMSGLKKGTKVRIRSKAKDNQYGWNAVWCVYMDDFVDNGKIYTVDYVNGSHGVKVFDEPYNWPFFCLEIVNEEVKVRLDSGEYDAVISDDGSGSVQVGCQKISYKTLKEIFDAATLLRFNL